MFLLDGLFRVGGSPVVFLLSFCSLDVGRVAAESLGRLI